MAGPALWRTGHLRDARGRHPVGDMLDRVLACAPDAEALGCAEQVEHCRDIVMEGTSADAQLEFLPKINMKVPRLPCIR